MLGGSAMSAIDRLYKKDNYTVQKSINLEDRLYTKLKEIIGVEKQEEVYETATRSIKLNKLENQFKIINEDIIKELQHYEPQIS